MDIPSDESFLLDTFWYVRDTAPRIIAGVEPFRSAGTFGDRGHFSLRKTLPRSRYGSIVRSIFADRRVRCPDDRPA